MTERSSIWRQRSCIATKLLLSIYRKARRGELRNFTGLDSPYERPINPELTLDAFNNGASDLADTVIRFMQQRGLLA
jgi:bifunctional enzyme CysN/CysC